MEKNKLLSIIVPVYKVEQYINKCLDSCIIKKTDEYGQKVVDEKIMDQLEVIIVNDGTPDNSAVLSREYVKRFPGTFRQIDKENGGHGSAWNVGLKEATGKYLRFLDSDDWLTNLDVLMNELDDCDSDIVFTQYVRHYKGTDETVLYDTAISPCNKCDLDPQKWGWHNDGYGFNAFNFWSITYRTSILKPLYPLFAEKVMFDDYIITSAALYYGRTCSSYPVPVYNYVVGREGQSMSVSDKRRQALSYLTCIRQYEIVWERVDKKNIPEDFLCTIRSAIKGYANFIFSYLPWLDYKKSKHEMRYVWNNHLQNYESPSHLTSRYSHLPFAVFYVLERVRSFINKS